MGSKKFSVYLIEKYAEWMKTQSEVKSPADFAVAVGINRQTLNKLMKKDTDNVPQLRTIHALAKVVGDDIYEFLEIKKSDLLFDIVKQSWGKLPDEVKLKIIDLIKPYTG